MSRTVLCIGDSHTRGRLGSSYVKKLQALLSDNHLQLLAFGINGQPTERIALRVGPVLKQHPNAAAVVLLAGANDCIAQAHPVMQQFYKLVFKASRPCCLEYAVKNMSEMLSYILREAPGTKVIVVTVPPLSEEPNSPAHKRVEEYNDQLKQMISSNFPSVYIADFYTAAIQYLQQRNPAYSSVGTPTELDKLHGTPPTSKISMYLSPKHTWSMTNFLGRQAIAVVKRRVLRIRWDKISQSRGMYLLTDQIHMNDTAASLMAQVLLPFVVDL